LSAPAGAVGWKPLFGGAAPMALLHKWILNHDLAHQNATFKNRHDTVSLSEDRFLKP